LRKVIASGSTRRGDRKTLHTKPNSGWHTLANIGRRCISTASQPTGAHRPNISSTPLLIAPRPQVQPVVCCNARQWNPPHWRKKCLAAATALRVPYARFAEVTLQPLDALISGERLHRHPETAATQAHGPEANQGSGQGLAQKRQVTQTEHHGQDADDKANQAEHDFHGDPGGLVALNTWPWLTTWPQQCALPVGG